MFSYVIGHILCSRTSYQSNIILSSLKTSDLRTPCAPRPEGSPGNGGATFQRRDWSVGDGLCSHEGSAKILVYWLKANRMHVLSVSASHCRHSEVKAVSVSAVILALVSSITFVTVAQKELLLNLIQGLKCASYHFIFGAHWFLKLQPNILNANEWIIILFVNVWTFIEDCYQLALVISWV